MSDNLRQQVLDFIEVGSTQVAGEGFNALALEVFAHQYTHVEMYRRFCDGRGISPNDVSTWDEIPAVPVDAFKQDLGLPGNREVHYLSSGTTHGNEARSRHCLRDTITYRASALAHFRTMVLPDEPGPMRCLVLGPSAETHPVSSLGQMFSWCVDEFGDESVSRCFDARGVPDVEAAVAWLEDSAAQATPVLILAISSALSGVFAALRTRKLELRLPADSRIVDTGGSKGAAPVLSAKGMLKAAWRYLHVAAYSCVNEYGMTEMLSQFYDDALASRAQGLLKPRAKLGPAWVRTIPVHPATLAPVDVGETGLLRHFDLANWDSISALQTLDTGHICGRGFALVGRAPLSEARGCSQLLALFNPDGGP